MRHRPVTELPGRLTAGQRIKLSVTKAWTRRRPPAVSVTVSDIRRPQPTRAQNVQDERGDVRHVHGQRCHTHGCAYLAIVNDVATVWHVNQQHALDWLAAPNGLLDGDTPAQRIHAGDAASVHAVIAAVADGIVI